MNTNKTTRIFLNKTLIFALLLLFVSGCVKEILPPAATGIDLHNPDNRSVENKKIVIDPGHGGPELGAVGMLGLRESEVNLGVSLYLWGLLKSAGADPILTRTYDTSVYTGKDFILKEDLQQRSDTSNKNNADLFISIHHNSAAGNRKRNDLNIFFKMSDPQRSKDIAIEVCKALQEKLNPEKAKVFPGNYHVLRNTRAPSILGEASFMTNRGNEHLLSYHRQLKLEAEGYFQGIVSYFRKGVPQITQMSPDNRTISSPEPIMGAHVHPGSDNATIKPSSIKITLDNRPVRSFSFQKNSIISFPPGHHLENSKHSFCISARNTNGNSSGTTCAEFTVSMPASMISLKPLFPVIPADGMSGTPIDVYVQDSFGRPIIDGIEIKFSTSAGSLLGKYAQTKNGHVRVTLISGTNPGSITVTAECGAISSKCPVLFGNSSDSLFMATIRDSRGNPVKNAKLIRDGAAVSVSDPGGFIYDRVSDHGNTSYKIIKKGYYDLNFSTTLNSGNLAVENLLLRPVDNGVFFGRRVVLDPAGWSDKSIPAIELLKNKIEDAGGNATLTWIKTPVPSGLKRVKKAGDFKADIFLSIETGTRHGIAGYYFKSTAGKQIATLFCDKLLQEHFCPQSGQCKISTSTKYVIIHTEMPAVWIAMPGSCPDSNAVAANMIYEILKEYFGTLQKQRP